MESMFKTISMPVGGMGSKVPVTKGAAVPEAAMLVLMNVIAPIGEQICQAIPDFMEKAWLELGDSLSKAIDEAFDNALSMKGFGD